jgi:hypothetical protein
MPGGAPGIPGAPGANPAAGLIQQILTTPRQPPSSINTSNAVSGGMTGIAGVGGSADGIGIHVIKDHSKYKQWEFIYDIKDDKTAIGAGAVMQNQLLQQQQQNQQNPQQPNSPFGSQQAQPGQTTSPTTTSSPTTPSVPPPSQ